MTPAINGGKDPGAVSGNLKEKDIVLTIAKNIAVRTSKPFLLTRWEDTFVSLKNRCLVANQSKSKFFLSLHCNSVLSQRPHGLEIWYYKDSKISKQIAGLFLDRLSPFFSANRGLKRAYIDNNGIYVLKHTKMPSILLELGFLSSPIDRKRLVDTIWQKAISCSISELLNLSSPC